MPQINENKCFTLFIYMWAMNKRLKNLGCDIFKLDNSSIRIDAHEFILILGNKNYRCFGGGKGYWRGFQLKYSLNSTISKILCASVIQMTVTQSSQFIERLLIK
ncbi:hypothetical protein pb186bvf_004428 [Paramecium bursaria]